MSRDKRYPSRTICWKCRNAVPDGKYGCPWSIRFAPVPGWTAERVKVTGYSCRGRKRILDSFSVIECPQFIGD